MCLLKSRKKLTVDSPPLNDGGLDRQWSTTTSYPAPPVSKTYRAKPEWHPPASRRGRIDRLQFTPEDVIGINGLASETGDQLGDLAAMVPGVAEHLGQNPLDIPAIPSAVASLPLEHAVQ